MDGRAGKGFGEEVTFESFLQEWAQFHFGQKEQHDHSLKENILIYGVAADGGRDGWEWRDTPDEAGKGQPGKVFDACPRKLQRAAFLFLNFWCNYCLWTYFGINFSFLINIYMWFIGSWRTRNYWSYLFSFSVLPRSAVRRTDCRQHITEMRNVDLGFEFSRCCSHCSPF